jgi:hypothetical protein
VAVAVQLPVERAVTAMAEADPKSNRFRRPATPKPSCSSAIAAPQ